ncbi:MAG: hypothetical protein VYB44_07455 [Bacteroidota bacterium]|nr:hypothetical protein [Bacteroidota bacterium]
MKVLKQPNPHIDIYDDLAVIYKDDAEFEMGLNKHDVENWARVQLPEFMTREKDPDDGLTTVYIDSDNYKEVLKIYVLNKEEQWKPVEE